MSQAIKFILIKLGWYCDFLTLLYYDTCLPTIHRGDEYRLYGFRGHMINYTAYIVSSTDTPKATQPSVSMLPGSLLQHWVSVYHGCQLLKILRGTQVCITNFPIRQLQRIENAADDNE